MLTNLPDLVISDDGTSVRRIEMPDLMPTNICFDIRGEKRAYVTLSARGTLAVPVFRRVRDGAAVRRTPPSCARPR